MTEKFERLRTDLKNIEQGITLHREALEDTAAAEGAARERYNEIMSAIYADVTEAQARRYEKTDASPIKLKMLEGDGERLATAPILDTTAYDGPQAAALREVQKQMVDLAHDFGYLSKRLAVLRNARDMTKNQIESLEEAAPEPEPAKRRGIFK